MKFCPYCGKSLSVLEKNVVFCSCGGTFQSNAVGWCVSNDPEVRFEITDGKPPDSDIQILKEKKRFHKCPKCCCEDFEHEGIADMSEESIEVEIRCRNCETSFYEIWGPFVGWEEVT